MRGDGVGQLAGSSIWLIETSTSGGIFLFSLMYCSNWVTTERLSASSSALVLSGLVDDLGIGLEELSLSANFVDARALAALDQHLDRAVRQLQQLQHGADRADL